MSNWVTRQMTHYRFKTLLLSASLSVLALTGAASADTVKIGLLVQLTGASSADGQDGEDQEEAHAPQENLRAGELHLVSDRRHQMPF